MADKYVKVSDIEEYCNTYSACLQGKGQSVAQAALRRVKEYAIENSADVQPIRRGRWEQIGENSAKCTACGGVLKSNGIDKTGKALIFNAVYHYCPYCGADMRGEDNG